MLKRIRQFIDSIVYAGLKPNAPRGPAKGKQWLGPLQGLLDSFLSGSAPKDPLYLSNRTMEQRVRLALLIAVPCVVLVGGVLLLLSNIYRASDPGPAPEPTAAVLAAKLLPNLDHNVKVDTNKDVQVLDAHIEREGGMKAAGTVKNNTNRQIHTTEIILNLTDPSGSHLGAVSAKVTDLAPNATVKFQVPIEQKEAAFALVREVLTQ